MQTLCLTMFQLTNSDWTIVQLSCSCLQDMVAFALLFLSTDPYWPLVDGIYTTGLLKRERGKIRMNYLYWIRGIILWSSKYFKNILFIVICLEVWSSPFLRTCQTVRRTVTGGSACWPPCPPAPPRQSAAHHGHWKVRRFNYYSIIIAYHFPQFLPANSVYILKLQCPKSSNIHGDQPP